MKINVIGGEMERAEIDEYIKKLGLHWGMNSKE